MRKNRPKDPCPPEEVALKSFFLGPQAENGAWLRSEVAHLLEHYLNWRRSLFPQDGRAISKIDQSNSEFEKSRAELSAQLLQLMRKLEKETPTFTPRYIGHMVSEVSLPATLGHVVMLLHNPNNASKAVSKIGLQIENEAIRLLLKMVGFSDLKGRGHFTSGGTVANFEGLWRARYRMDHFLSLGIALKAKKHRRSSDIFSDAHMGWDAFHAALKKHSIDEKTLRSFSCVAESPWRTARLIRKHFEHDFDGPVVLAPGSKHYSWQKGVSIFGLGNEAFWPVDLDKFGHIDVSDLKIKIEEARYQKRPIVCAVTVAGTTELGEMDPIHEVQDLLDSYKRHEGLDIWHHVDAAYGGFYCTMLDSKTLSKQMEPNTLEALRAIKRVDSVTIDPHKLGYVPYSCGAILVPNEQNYTVSSFSAPYLSSKSKNSGLWSSTIEGSRPASGAAAMWLAAKSIGLGAKGYGRILVKGLEARQKFEEILETEVPLAKIVKPVDLNILCFCLAEEGEKSSVTNRRTERIYSKIEKSPLFAISKTDLSLVDYEKLATRHIARWKGVIDSPSLLLIRLVLMNPFIGSRETNTDFIAEFCQCLKVWCNTKPTK